MQSKLIIIFILKDDVNRYWNGYKPWNIDYNYGWTFNPKEAEEFTNIEDIHKLINEKLKEEYQSSFGDGDYRIETILRIKSEEEES